MSRDCLSSSEAENAIEITNDCIEKLQDHFRERALPRGEIIQNYIIPWAQEAETLWETLKSSDNDDLWELPYYDFIDEFSRIKLLSLGITEGTSDVGA